MNMTCYAVIFVDKSDFRAKILGLYSEGPMTITYDHGHESAAELFRIERWNFEEAYNDAVEMLAMRFGWAYSLMNNELLAQVKDARQVQNEKLGRHDANNGEED